METPNVSWKKVVIDVSLIYDCFGHSLPQLEGNLSNHNGDVRKTTGLITRTSTLHMHHAFFLHYLVVTARLQHETFQCDVFKL